MDLELFISEVGNPSNVFRVGPKVLLINEKSVYDKAWIVRIQVDPTSECFKQRSVHDDS